MREIYIKIGSDGGDLAISKKCIHDVIFYQFKRIENFEVPLSLTFVSLGDAWNFVKTKYPKWYQLYLVEINTQMIELVKKEYIRMRDKNEYTIDSWLVHLTGRGIGF